MMMMTKKKKLGGGGGGALLLLLLLWAATAAQAIVLPSSQVIWASEKNKVCLSSTSSAPCTFRLYHSDDNTEVTSFNQQIPLQCAISPCAQLTYVCIDCLNLTRPYVWKAVSGPIVKEVSAEFKVVPISFGFNTVTANATHATFPIAWNLKTLTPNSGDRIDVVQKTTKALYLSFSTLGTSTGLHTISVPKSFGPISAYIFPGLGQGASRGNEGEPSWQLLGYK